MKKLVGLVMVAMLVVACSGSPVLLPGTSAPPAPPAPPAASYRSKVAILSWAGDAPHYVVEVSAAGAVEQRIEVSRTLVVVSQLEPDTEYQARVMAVVDGVQGPPSEPVTFRTSTGGYPVAPPAVSLKSTTSTSMTVSWPAARAGGRYQVEIAKDASFKKAKVKSVKAEKVTFKKLSNKAEYHVRVRLVDKRGNAESEWSTSEAAKPLKSVPLTVGTYNILKASVGNWSKRKSAVARTILGEDPDVVGVQEATPIQTGGGRQYNQLVQALGPNWQIVDDNKDHGPARIVYNRDRLETLDSGAELLRGSMKWAGNPRFIAWATFRQRATGKQFLFVTTHFSPRDSSASDPHRAASAKQLVSLVKRVNRDDLPVIVTGDFNSGRNRTSSNRVYQNLISGSLIDPMATATGKLGHPKKAIRPTLKTWNGFVRKARFDNTAPFLDYILVTPMKVKEWEVVAKLNSRGRYVGAFPSDHNMMRATVELP